MIAVSKPKYNRHGGVFESKGEYDRYRATKDAAREEWVSGQVATGS